MKLLYVLVLGLAGCLHSASTWAQQLRGAYYTTAKERGFSGELFHFAGNRFRFLSFNCTGSTEGRGTFAIRNDSLLLYCEKMAADTAVAAFPLADTAALPTFHIRAVDKLTGGALAGATITSRAGRVGALTDTSGRAHLTYLPPVDDVLAVAYVGYYRTFIPLHRATSQRFTVRMGPPYYFKAGDTLVFQLKDVRAHSFAYRQCLDILGVENDKLPYFHGEKISAAEARRHFRGK